MGKSETTKIYKGYSNCGEPACPGSGALSETALESDAAPSLDRTVLPAERRCLLDL